RRLRAGDRLHPADRRVGEGCLVETGGASMNTRKRLGMLVALTAPVAGVAGAAVEWLWDPDRGKARRRQLVDRTTAAVRRQTRGRAQRLSMRAKYERGRVRGGFVRAGGGGI